MTPKIVSVFNNKGGVGKTTLTFHLAHALGELGKKVLLVDFDPQCNLTIVSMTMEQIEKIWTAEDAFIEDFAAAKENESADNFDRLLDDVRSIHFILKPTEDGTAELPRLPPPASLTKNVDLLPGRLTLHLFEAKIGERWSGIYQGDPLALRTATRARELAYKYADMHGYDIVIFDTSPSLGALNRDILTLTDGFLIPCSPDLFSIYGIRNIGGALDLWRKQFDTIFHLLSDTKRSQFPEKFVRLIGYTLYNARRYSGQKNPLGLAAAHYHYAEQIPGTIRNHIDPENSLPFDEILGGSIGGDSVIYAHNTFPSLAQKYHLPMWRLPESELQPEDKSTIGGNQQKFKDTQQMYHAFASDVIDRIAKL
ncbi:ParA family protein [Thioclava pacifica]|uniref:AAA domain-containing protein n=1 Tax=Thioclava pacifica DSM 10166 TaxID=1353537 RepID=A0A074JE74_9RHOB|nr:AAA family ATPase [Thioclava pacifica]KEO54120.1 hypothetical protein TP2_04160 [Thioclava pacifica DSM 10166]